MPPNNWISVLLKCCSQYRTTCNGLAVIDECFEHESEVLIAPSNAPDQKRAEFLAKNPASAPVFCIWMLGSRYFTLMQSQYISVGQHALEAQSPRLFQA
jgi:hypothetical protein